MKYRVLGPVAASIAGQDRVNLGGKKQRLVLALLLINANRVISQDVMVDAIWDGEPPETGRRTLHTYISNLRKITGDDIERDGEGYALLIDEGDIDALLFERLVSDARPKAAAEPEKMADLLTDALALWTGRPFGDLGFEPALIAEANRLDEERVTAQEMRIDADLRLGRHQEVLQELEALVRDHPYREALTGQLMLALYRSGRQAEALRVFNRTRQRLADELGIDPSAELQDLEMRILHQDPDLAELDPHHSSGSPNRAARGYELYELIASSGLGKRYRGFQSSIGREVSVLKLDAPVVETPEFIRRFESDMKLVSRLEHPHLAPVFDYWREPETAYVVTPFYRGGTLEAGLADRPWGLAAAVKLLDQIAGALAYLHRQGYSHGAVSAQTILLDDEQNAYLADTGLGWLPSEGQPGTSHDVYSLGALVYSVLVGDEPTQGIALSSVRPDVPPELDHALARAVHSDPDSRYERVDDLARAVRRSVGLDVPTTSVVDHTASPPRNPYKGLRAFQEPDAADFHGRDALVGELVDATTRTRMITVVGPSGSGKSSVVRAGLIPKLRSGAVAGSERWLITDMFPGSHPFEELERALLRVAARRPPRLHETLTSDAGGLIRAIEEIEVAGDAEVLILVDQFEELFSLVSSANEREQFLELLAATASKEEGRVRFVLTLRADFFDQPLQYPDFAEVLRANVVTVSPPTADGLARAISQPALDSGMGLEPGLVNRVVDDVRQEPGGLPLLQYALTELYAAQEGDMLTLAAYGQVGGVAGSVARRAEEIYSDLNGAGREAARQLFLRLVTVDEVADDTRRRVLQTELMSLGVDRSTMLSVMRAFGAFRLLSFDQDAASRTPTVELAHEALLREWDRLAAWIDERREDLLVHRRVSVMVRDWRASGSDPSYLLRGARLEQALTWRSRTDISISEEEEEFLEASADAEAAEQAEREALEAKAARRRKWAMGILAGGLVSATVLGVYALGQRETAADNAALATARELSLSSISISDDDPELGVLLALEAIDATEQVGSEPLPESLSAMWRSFTRHRVELTIPGVGFLVSAFSPDGSILATDQAGSTDVLLLDPSSGNEVGRLVGPETGPPREVLFTGDGSFILVARNLDASEKELVRAIDVYDSITLELTSSLLGPSAEYHNLSLNESGHLAAFAFNQDSETERMVLWDISVGGEPISIQPIGPVGFSADGTLVLGTRGEPGVPGGEVFAIDWTTGQEVWAFPTELEPASFALSPDATKIALASISGDVGVFDLATEELVFPKVELPDPQVITWNPDGSTLAASGNDSDVTLVDAATGQIVLVLSGHDGAVFSTAWHPHGERLATVENGGDEVRIWNVSPGGPHAISMAESGILETVPGASLLVWSVENLHAEILNEDGARVSDLLEVVGSWPYLSYASGDGEAFAGVTPEGRGVVVGIDGSVLAQLPECALAVGLSADATAVAVHTASDCELDDRPATGVIDVANGTSLITPEEGNLFLAGFSSPTNFDGKTYVALSVSNTRFVTSDLESRVELWALDPVERVAVIDDELVGSVPFIYPRFSPDGSLLGMGTGGPTAIVVDVEKMVNGETEDEYIVFNQEVHSGNTPRAIPTSSGLVATGSFDGFYRLWDLETGQLLFELEVGETLPRKGFGFNEDGSTLYYLHDATTIGRLPTNVDEMIALAEGSITRELTHDECRQYLHTDGC